MKFFFLSLVMLCSLTSCSNINFILEADDSSNFLKNKTAIYVDGWENPALKEVLFLKLGEVTDKKFILKALVNEKQIKRSVNENQVAQKIDYEITINYTLSAYKGGCPELTKTEISNFSFTPKSSGYNFASDVLLQNLFEEAVSDNSNNFISFVSNKLQSHNCLDED